MIMELQCKEERMKVDETLYPYNFKTDRALVSKIDKQRWAYG